jgi:hypothetical protein
MVRTWVKTCVPVAVIENPTWNLPTMFQIGALDEVLQR